MYVNYILVSLILLSLLFLIGLCTLSNKNKNNTRMLLALVLVLILVLINKYYSEKEAFATMIDENVLLSGGNRLEREQEETSNQLDVLSGQIRLMKKIYLNNINDATIENTPSINLRCTPPTTYFSDGGVQESTPEYDSLSLESMGLSANEIQNLINKTNTLIN
tara:strand:- start:321 stop:812 length:492 start_codon:yes stop_codon:yes gene_type:complete